MKQVNKITLFYTDGTFQEVIVPHQSFSIPPRSMVSKQLLQEVNEMDKSISTEEKSQNNIAWPFPK